MSTRPSRRLLSAIGLAVALTITVAACGSDDNDSSADKTTTTAAAETTTTAMDDTTAATDPGTIVDVAAGNEDFTTLVAAVKAAGLAETLSGDGPFTVFAPTNAAFEALPAGTVDTLLEPENKDKLAAVLTYHVVPSKAMAGDLTDGMKVKTVQGEELTIGVDGDKVTVTDAAGNTVNVVTADVPASNGVIHVIDGVLLPSAAG